MGVEPSLYGIFVIWASPRCASLEVLPAKSPMPHKGCYRTTPAARGDIVTRRSQEEYTAVVRARYAVADRATKGRTSTSTVGPPAVIARRRFVPSGGPRRSAGAAPAGGGTMTWPSSPPRNASGRSAIGSVANYSAPRGPRSCRPSSAMAACACRRSTDGNCSR